MREAKAGPGRGRVPAAAHAFYPGLLVECFGVLRLKLESLIQTKNSWDFGKLPESII